VLAGAGSGKTRVLAYRAAYLVHSGRARPHQILALTFTNKAAGELKERIISIVGDEGQFVVAGTFHSIFARLMRRDGMNIGVDPHFGIVDSEDKRRLIKAIMKENNIPSETVRPAEIDWIISRAKNNLTSPEELEKQAFSPINRTAVQVYRIYERRLRQMKGMDFDDLLIRPIQAFKEHPDFLERLQKRFQYVLVDEFQDTNRAQYMLVREIAGKHHNICVVGDDDQSIYGWRGATVENILDFERDWKETKIIKLEQNYRSRKPILDVAWSVIKNNSRRRAKKLWTEKEGGQQVEVIESGNEEDEALKVVGYIEEDKTRHHRTYNEYAVLYRTNAQSLAFERAFRSAKIAYKVVGGLRFYERKEIKDILAYLRLIVNPSDDISLLRIINYPPRGIGEAVVDEIQARARAEDVSVNQAIAKYISDPELAPRRRNALENFMTLIGEFRKTVSQTDFAELVKEIIMETDLEARLKAEEKDDLSRAESKVANLHELLGEVERYVELNPESTIEAFLEEVSLITDADQVDEKARGVNLMTLHSAKGLEFPVVFIVGVEEGLLPLPPRNSSTTTDDIEEERRLFYVGATRAMERLCLSYANIRFRWGSFGSGGLSRFIDEIPPEMLKTREKTGMRYGRTTLTARRKPRTEKIPLTSRIIGDVPKTNSSTELNSDDLRKGLLVNHPKFGLGIVTGFTQNGPDSRVTVDFDDHGLKTLVLKFAKLELAK